MKQILIILIVLFPAFLMSQSRVEVDITNRIDTTVYANEVLSFMVINGDTTRVMSSYSGGRLRSQIFERLKPVDEEIENIDQMIEALTHDIELYAYQIRLMQNRLAELRKDRTYNLLRKNRNGR